MVLCALYSNNRIAQHEVRAIGQDHLDVDSTQWQLFTQCRVHVFRARDVNAIHLLDRDQQSGFGARIHVISTERTKWMICAVPRQNRRPDIGIP